jgi:hypothetical protein
MVPSKNGLISMTFLTVWEAVERISRKRNVSKERNFEERSGGDFKDFETYRYMSLD